MKISRQEGSISGFRGCGTGPHIWRPRAPVFRVGKFCEHTGRERGRWRRRRPVERDGDDMPVTVETGIRRHAHEQVRDGQRTYF
jgi:hypothetical protein